MITKAVASTLQRMQLCDFTLPDTIPILNHPKATTTGSASFGHWLQLQQNIPTLSKRQGHQYSIAGTQTPKFWRP